MALNYLYIYLYRFQYLCYISSFDAVIFVAFCFSSCSSASCSSTDDANPVVHDLSKVLLQIQQMIEPRYMNAPLGEDEETRLRKQKEALDLAFQGFTPRKIRERVWDKKTKKKRKDGDSSDEDNEDGN